jgi:hypothetical protein
MSMSSIITSPAVQGISMSSREIADLCEKRHDNVKRAIDMLAERGVIEFLQIEGPSSATKPTTAYHLGKRDTLVVVAQLSPEFTARVVDRWMELEAERAPFDPATLLNNLAIMRGLLLSYTERVLAHESKIDAMRDDVAAHERLTKADGSLSITEAAKALAMRPKDLFQWLSHNGWIYKRPNGAAAPAHMQGSTPGTISDADALPLEGRADGHEAGGGRKPDKTSYSASALNASVQLVAWG